MTLARCYFRYSFAPSGVADLFMRCSRTTLGNIVKIALYDGILETHVAQSLERALTKRGHQVINTGKVGKGFAYPQDPATVAQLEAVLDEVLSQDPDVIFVFRPASLPFGLLRRARASGARLVAWFSDDPVLWNLSYGPGIEFYDLVLHCGNSEVLSFYERKHGRPTGINFPFWTDNVAFPRVYGTNETQYDAMFLGNVRGQVRSKRYEALAGLEARVRVFGSVDEDPLGLWGGYLDSDEEVADAASRARFGVSIPQVFSDHSGMPTWFPGLGDLSFFQYPSRVIQYAAMGLPIIAMVPDATHLSSFPEIVCASDADDLNRQVRRLVSNMDLADLSARTHNRFERHFSADARAIALEALLGDEVHWRGMSVEGRTSLFTEFQPEGSAGDSRSALAGGLATRPQEESTTESVLAAHLMNVPRPSRSLRVTVLGVGWADELSDVRTCVRALTLLGHKVETINPHTVPHLFSEGSQTGSKLSFDAAGYAAESQSLPDAFFFIGDWVSIMPRAALDLADAGCLLVHLSSTPKQVDLAAQRRAALMHFTSFANASTVAELRGLGFRNVGYMPKLVDRAFVSELLKLPPRPNSVSILAERPSDLERHEELSAGCAAVDRKLSIRGDGVSRATLASVAEVCRAATVITLPTSLSKKTALVPGLGYALFSGSKVVIARGSLSASSGNSLTGIVQVANGKELREKEKRFLTVGTGADRLRGQRLQGAIHEFSAEERLNDVLETLLTEDKAAAEPRP